ncbi:hypothetical protein pb186bvf_017868 [Paramecium bursaria]
MHQSQQLSKFAQKFSDANISSPNQARQLHIRKDRNSPISGQLRKQPSNETDDNSQSRRDKTKHILYEIATTNNPKKLVRLIKTFQTSDYQLKQISENLTKIERVNLFFTIQINKLIECVNFQHSLYQSLTQDGEDQMSVLKVALLWNYEQFYGNQGQILRVLEVMYEFQNIVTDYRQFEEEYQIQVQEIEIIHNRYQLRLLFVLSYIDLIKALKSTVQLVEQLENSVFQQLKQNTIPEQLQLESLIISYTLISEQLDQANRLNLSHLALEIMGKNTDAALLDIKKKFIINALRFAQKYLGNPWSEKLNVISKKLQPESNQRNSGHHLNVVTQFLIEILDVSYIECCYEYLDHDKNIQSLLSYQLYQNIIDKLLPDYQKRKGKTNSLMSEEKEVQSQKVIPVKQFSIKSSKPDQQMTQTQPNQPTQTTKVSKSLKNSNVSDSQELDIIQGKIVTQQKELDELRAFYNQSMLSKKTETNNRENLQKKIDQLENIVSQLKNENQGQKREKDQKQAEVNELKNQLGELQDKQQKLEKLMQQQNQPQQQQLLRTQVNQSQKSENSSKQNTQTTMHIQIPLKLDGQRRLVREQSQNSHSPMEDLMDDISPHIFKSNQPMLQLLERLDMQCSFSRMYNKYSSSNDSQVWDSEVTLQSSFKIEAQIMEDADGKQLAIKAYNEGQLSCSVLLPFFRLCSLLGYVDIYDMLPTNLPNLSNTHQFFKFYILPYTAVVFDDNLKEFKIVIWPKPCGMLDGLKLEYDFLDYKCLIIVNHIECDQLRIYICDSRGTDIIRMDLDMDYSTMDTFFEEAIKIKDEYVYESKNIMYQMTELSQKLVSDDVTEALQDRHFNKDKIQQVQQKIQKNQSYACEKYTLKKPAEFLKYIKAIVQSFEQKLRQLNMNFSSCIIGTKYFRCKSWATGQKNQIQIVRDNSNSQTIEVFLQNCFETFGPEKTKLKVQGKTQVQYNIIQKEFGLTYEKLQNEERIAIFQQLLYSFNLNVFDKLCEQTVEQFDKNPIIQNPYDCGTYKRVLTHDNGKIAPLTVSIIGSNRKMSGVKFSVYNIEDSQEYGIFLPATQYEWDVRQLGKMKLKKSVANVPFSEYLLTQIIKCPMVFQVLCKILLNTDIKGNQINSNELKKRQSYIERIDNLITWQEIVANI